MTDADDVAYFTDVLNRIEKVRESSSDPAISDDAASAHEAVAILVTRLKWCIEKEIRKLADEPAT